MDNQEREPSVLEYAIVIVLTIISLVGMLFGKKIQSDKE